MKAKYLLTALAVPAMFAACSQDEIVTNGQDQQVLLGQIAGDVDFTLTPESRLAWDADNNVAWETEDGFSMFWVGDAAEESLMGKANALYRKNGDAFTSQNIVYEGNHIIVYPADYTHLSEKAIEVNVGGEQSHSVALGKRSVWTTDSLLTIKAPLKGDAKPQPGVIYAGGYGETVPAELQALSSNLVMDLNFAMGNATSVTVKKVVLESNNPVFVVDGTLKAEGLVSGKNNRHVDFVPGKPVKAVTLTMEENNVVTAAKPELTVQFSLLPSTNVTIVDNTTYSIKVYTNYGIVTIDDAKNVLARTGKVYCDAANTAIDDEDAATIIKNVPLNLKQEIELMAAHTGEKVAYRGAEKETTIKAYGKKVGLGVTVNMKDASITGMEVANSQELIDAYDTYVLLEKDGEENFVLKNKKPFELTPAAVAKIFSNKKIELTQEDNDTIKLVGAHTSIPSFTVKNDKNEDVVLFNTSTKKLVLGAEGTWAIDVDAATAANTWSVIVNDGTLTLSESNPAKGTVSLTKRIVNRNAVNFEGNVVLPVRYLQQNGVTNVPADSDVTLTISSDVKSGLVKVSGILDVNAETTTIAKDAVVEVYGRFRHTDNGNITNLGTIKIMDKNATAIIKENGNATSFGSIELINRDDLVSVTGENQGYIKWACNVASLKKVATDVFNYIIVNDNVKIEDDSAAISHAEVNATARITGTNVIFTSLFVNKGNTLIIPTASKITTTDLVLTGDIEVLGEFIYTNITDKGGDIFYKNK